MFTQLFIQMSNLQVHGYVHVTDADTVLLLQMLYHSSYIVPQFHLNLHCLLICGNKHD